MSLQSLLAGCVIVLGLLTWSLSAVDGGEGILWISIPLLIGGTVWWIKAKLSPKHPDNR